MMKHLKTSLACAGVGNDDNKIYGPWSNPPLECSTEVIASYFSRLVRESLP
jgi:hypothetical protein